MTMPRGLDAVVAIALTALIAACGSPAHDGLASEHGPPSDSAARLNAEARANIEPGALATVLSAPVVGWAGPDGKPFEVSIRTSDPSAALTRRFGSISMRNSLRVRAPNLGQYPCASCHLGRATKLADQRIGDAHQNITAVHPRQTGGVCSTCHSATNVELLALKSGERATLDHTYRLCAQCHFSQAAAWAGGGHGKRLDGWQGRRIVMGCADCHNPHRPAVEPRIPFRAPRIARVRGHEP